MGDVVIPKPDPTKGERVGARVQELIDSGHEFYAIATTGHPSGRVRRPTLFLIAIVSVAIGFVLQPALVAALIAIFLLAFTDNDLT